MSEQKYEQAEDEAHRKGAAEERLTYHYGSHRSGGGGRSEGPREGPCEAQFCEGYSALRGDSGGSSNSGTSTHGLSNGRGNEHRTVGINLYTGRAPHSSRADARTMSCQEDPPSNCTLHVRGSSRANPPRDTRVAAKRWLLRDWCGEAHPSYEAQNRSTHDRGHHLELSIPPTNRNGKRKKIQRRYTSHPNVSGRPRAVTPVRKFPRSRFAHKDEAVKIKGREEPTQWGEPHSGENAKVRCGTLVGMSKLRKIYERSDDYHVRSGKRHAPFHGDDGHMAKTGKGTKQEHQSNGVAPISRYAIEGGEDPPDVNPPSGNKLCQVKYLRQVKFLCQAKGYDLKRISLMLSAKRVNHVFHDRDTILCAFLTPEKSAKYFFSFKDLGNVANFNLMRDVTPSDAEYIVFIFINGSVVIWDNFPNGGRNDVFINKVIMFLNSFSDELLPVHVVQEDTMYYHEWGGLAAPSEGLAAASAGVEAPSGGLEAPSGGLEAPSGGLEAPSGGLEAPSDGLAAPMKSFSPTSDGLAAPVTSSPPPLEGFPLISGGVIRLRSGSLEQKLTVSFALSQSIRLDVHEMLMDITINKLFIVSKQIASRGTCTMSNQEVSRMLDVYSSIINVNAVQDFLDVPEYFWNKVQYEHAWFEIYTYLEIPERIGILNKRYNYYKDFLKAIKTEVYNEKTFQTYRVIVLLLFIHVCALIVNDLFFAQ
ncbi:conserved protein, unknown function [Plasmodium vivax]|nr:conserved protein, unknown function [Plasmodium vivax]